MILQKSLVCFVSKNEKLYLHITKFVLKYDIKYRVNNNNFIKYYIN